MDNSEIAGVFRDIAELLLKKKENWFKIRAYQRAADSIDGLTEPLAGLVADGRLREIPGVGEAITRKVTELITTGRLEYYERLKAESPEGME